MKKGDSRPKKLGSFTGVFVPTVLSILGVIMYLRLGYVVGTAGMLGAATILLIAVSITLSTALSLSSITTNIRIGAGGAYSIISKTFGLEVGGTIGIPLYLAQVFSVALYIFGFTEGWEFIFPHHPKLIVLTVVFLTLLALTTIKLTFAIGAQLVTLALIVASLISIFAGGSWWIATPTIPTWGTFPETTFWAVFALFFPAVTGLMAGVGMSGELSDPKRQIPKGLLWAIGLTTIIYIALIVWFGHSATSTELIADTTLIIKLSAFAPLVILGLLAATFSSAITTLIAAQRLLQSLGNNTVIPFSNFFAKNKNGLPVNSALLTGAIVAASLSAGNLDTVAPVLTMFFLISYAMTNLVVFVEQTLGLVSFRPTLRIPKIIPLYGAIGSIVIMFLINAIAGILALIFLFVVYLALVKKQLIPKEGDVRSGLFRTFSEWAAKKIMKLPESSKHIWRPNVVLPVVTTSTLLGNFPLVKSFVYPNGTMTVLGLNLEKRTGVPEEITLTKKQLAQQLKDLPLLVQKFGEEGIFTSSSTITVKDYANGISVSLEAMESQIFKPNVLFLPFKPNQISTNKLRQIMKTAETNNVGVIVFDKDVDIGLGSEEDIHVWIPAEELNNDFYEEKTYDLAMLLAFKLRENWKGRITIWMCTKEEDTDKAKSYLRKLVYEARLPSNTVLKASAEPFITTLSKAPSGDVHIVPIQGSTDIDYMLKISKKERKSFLFVSDSGKEDILA